MIIMGKGLVWVQSLLTFIPNKISLALFIGKDNIICHIMNIFAYLTNR